MEQSENNQFSMGFSYTETGVVTVYVNMQATALNEIVALEILKDKLEEEIRNLILRENGY